jgi:hypothetical protein
MVPVLLPRKSIMQMVRIFIGFKVRLRRAVSPTGAGRQKDGR